MWTEDSCYYPEYWENQLYAHEQCCNTCTYFKNRICVNPDLDEFDVPSPDGTDCCDDWESREAGDPY